MTKYRNYWKNILAYACRLLSFYDKDTKFEFQWNVIIVSDSVPSSKRIKDRKGMLTKSLGKFILITKNLEWKSIFQVIIQRELNSQYFFIPDRICLLSSSAVKWHRRLISGLYTSPKKRNHDSDFVTFW